MTPTPPEPSTDGGHELNPDVSKQHPQDKQIPELPEDSITPPSSDNPSPSRGLREYQDKQREGDTDD